MKKVVGIIICFCFLFALGCKEEKTLPSIKVATSKAAKEASRSSASTTQISTEVTDDNENVDYDITYVYYGKAKTLYCREIQSVDNDVVSLIVKMKDGRKLIIPFTVSFIEYSSKTKCKKKEEKE
jgi:hypothetical protein